MIVSLVSIPLSQSFVNDFETKGMKRSACFINELENSPKRQSLENCDESPLFMDITIKILPFMDTNTTAAFMRTCKTNYTLGKEFISVPRSTLHHYSARGDYETLESFATYTKFPLVGQFIAIRNMEARITSIIETSEQGSLRIAKEECSKILDVILNHPAMEWNEEYADSVFCLASNLGRLDIFTKAAKTLQYSDRFVNSYVHCIARHGDMRFPGVLEILMRYFIEDFPKKTGERMYLLRILNNRELYDIIKRLISIFPGYLSDPQVKKRVLDSRFHDSVKEMFD